MPQRLTEDSRSRLDSIVHEMTANGEPEDAIKFVVSDFQSKHALPDKPFSTEDFTPSKPGFNVGSYLEKTARALNPIAIAKGIAQTGMDTRPEDVALGPAAVLAPFFRQAAGAAGGEARTAYERAKEGRLSEAAGHGAAALLPVVGPSAAHAGEAFNAGDTEQGAAEATALLAPFAAAKVAPGLASIGEQLAAKAGPLAQKAAPYAIPVAADIAAHHFFGQSPIYTAIKLATKSVKAARGVAPEAEEAAANAGGTLIKAKAPIAEQAIAYALEEVRQAPAPPPARTTTPPEPSLPPGYTPRSSVPKPKPAKMDIDTAIKQAKAAIPDVALPEPAAPAAPPTRPYFFRSPEEVAAIQARKSAKAEPVVASDVADPASYPASWRSRLDTPAARTTRTNAGRATKAEVAQLAQTLTESGLSPTEAIRQISKDATLAPETRTQLMTALGKLAKGKK